MLPQMSALPSELDKLDADTIRTHAEEILTRFESWLQRAARSIAGSSNPYIDDVVQEGRLALWQALKTFDPKKGKLPSWLVYKARYRMYEVVTGKKWTGQPDRLHGRQGAAEPDHMFSLDFWQDRTDPYENGGRMDLHEAIAAPDNMEASELRYHDHELAAAFGKLTEAQRQYVAARFYAGMTTAEMKSEVFGYDPSALWNAKGSGAKARLRDILSHMKDLA